VSTRRASSCTNVVNSHFWRRVDSPSHAIQAGDTQAATAFEFQ
jgi:hypothetical protein